MLHHAASVDAVDAAAVVRREGQGNRRDGVNARCPYLPSPGRLRRRLVGIHPVRDIEAELVVAQPAAQAAAARETGSGSPARTRRRW